MKQHIGALLISLGIVLSVIIASDAFLERNKYNESISVTGLGSRDFVSDLAVWQASFSRKSMNLQEAYQSLEEDRSQVREYLVSQGYDEGQIVFSAVDINKDFDYRYDDNGRSYNVFTGHRLTQRVELESQNIDLIEKISRNITDLINKGVEINSYSPDYYYTKLAELKIEMIASATEDARTRAEQIAENSGASLGDLQSAQMGIFQIIGQNSNEDYSWGGTFNTQSKMKTATITMKLKFGIE
jgi:hypothetical protein